MERDETLLDIADFAPVSVDALVILNTSAF
jgi:hypothetical protein